MIAGTIVDRLDMSLTLTFSNEASQQMVSVVDNFLSVYFTLLKNG